MDYIAESERERFLILQLTEIASSLMRDSIGLVYEYEEQQ